MAEGIEVRHRRGSDPCASHTGGRCNCEPTYRPSVYDKRAKKKIYPPQPFKSEAAAKAWRQDALVGLRKGTMRAFEPITVAQAAEAFMAAAQAGTIVSGHGEPYRAGTIRYFTQSLRKHIVPRFGHYRLSDLRHVDVQAYADELTANGVARGTVQGIMMPLSVIYRRAVKRGEVVVNPATGVTGGRRTGYESRYPTPTEAAALIAILPTAIQRAMWGTLFYAGLRVGEMLALRWEDVDFAAGRLRIERSYDGKAGVFNEPKTRKGKRTVPLLAQLRPLLLEHRMNEAQAGRDTGLVFSKIAWAGSEEAYRSATGRKADDPAGTPVGANTMTEPAYRVWKDAGMERVNPHGCRYTFAACAIAAMGAAGRFDPKIIQTAMGHTSITMTYDLYGKLFPGADADLGKMMDDYLAAQAEETLRLAQISIEDDDEEA
jgi:integrase